MEPAVGGGCDSALEKDKFVFKSGRNRWWSVLIRRLRGFSEVSFSKKRSQLLDEKSFAEQIVKKPSKSRIFGDTGNMRSS